MGSTAFVLKAILGIDTSEYENGLNDAKGKAHSFGGAIGNGLKTAAKLGGAALVGATTAVTAFGAASIKVGKEFDTSMSQVAATFGFTSDQLADSNSEVAKTFEALRDKAREMGGSTIYSASEAAEGLNILAMSGFDASTSMSMLEDVLHLAAAGSMDMGNAAAYIAGSMKGFNDASKDSGYYADLIAKGATLANTSVTDLGEAMSDGAADAAAYSQSAESMTVALLKLAEGNVTGSAASTSLRAAMKDLYTGTDQAKEALQELKVNAYDPVTHEARDFNDVVNDLSKSLEGMTEEEANNYKQTIFGIQGLAAYNKMTTVSAEKQKYFADSLASASDGIGSAAQQYDTMTNNLEGSIKGWGSALDEFKITISDKLTSPVKEFVDFGTTGLQTITAAFKSGGLTGAVDAFGKVLTDGLGMVIEKAPIVVNAGMQLIGALGKGIIDNTPQIVSAAVAIVVKLADGLIKGLPELAKGAVTLVKSLGQAFKDNAAELQLVGSNLLDLMLDGILNGVPKLVEEFAQFFADNFPVFTEKAVGLIIDLATALTNPDTLSSLLESAVKILLALAQGLLAAIPQLIAAVPVIIQNLIDGIVESAPMLLSSAVTLIGMLLQGIIENLPLILASGIRIVSSLIDGIISLVPALVSTGIQLIGELIATIMRCFPKLVTNGMEIVKAIIEGILGHISTFAKTAIELINQFIKAIVSSATKIANAGKDIVNFIKDGFMQKVNEAKQWGKDLIDNFIGGIVEKANALKDTVTGVAGMVKDFIGFSEPEKGPLSNFHTFAPDMMQLFAQGIKENENLVADQLRKSFDFKDTILESTGEYSVSATAKSDSRIISLLQRIADSDKDVKIVLEGDTRRLFRAMQSEAKIYQNTTGQNAFA